MLELAWNVGDGLIISNLSFPTALVRQGALDLAMTKLRASAAMHATTSAVSLKSCTCTCRYRAMVRRRNAAPGRMGAGALIQGHLLKQRMLKLPVPPDTENAILAAQRHGKSVDDMVELISDDLLTQVGTVIARHSGRMYCRNR